MTDDIAATSAEHYPERFAKQYDVIECLSSTDQGETLLVFDRSSGLYRIAKLRSVENSAGEAQILSCLSHPGLPKIIDYYIVNGKSVLIREFVKGIPLDELVSQRKLFEDEIVDICVQLCDILTYLHSQSPPVIHRDIKPQNVIIGDGGEAALIDFGIARVYKEDAARDTVFSGTDTFMPPEQYGFAQTDAHADIYSLGMLLKYLLTGGDMEKTIKNPRLRRIVNRCTAFLPAARYKNAEKLREALLSSDGKKTAKRWTIAAALTALCCGILIGQFAIPRAIELYSGNVVSFSDPIIEKAARLMLDKPLGPITKKELETVSELFIVHGDAQADNDGFITEYKNTYGDQPDDPESCVTTLSDLKYFPNLKDLSIAYGKFSDLSAISGCPALEHLELYDNYELNDIGALAGLITLRYDGLVNANKLRDIYRNRHEYRHVHLTSYSRTTILRPLLQMDNFNF